MKANNPQIERLRKMVALEEKRARLHLDLAGVIEQMAALKDRLFDDISTRMSAATRPASTPSGRGARRGKARRGALKEKIMAALEAAGSAGVHVKDIAAELATKPVNIHSWFHSTSKRNPAIRKISGGHYRLETRGGAPTPAGAQQRSGASARVSSRGATSKTSSTRKRSPGKRGAARSGGRRGPSKRGQLSARIMRELEAAGSKGITVRDLSNKVGAKYKNVYIWFATTGKKNAKIKKVAPATFRLAA